MLIKEVPVQFLPAYNPLLEEALREARPVRYQTTLTRVLRVEHLAAMCLQTGRAKARERVRLLHEQAMMDHTYLTEVLRRHQLEEMWKSWTN